MISNTIVNIVTEFHWHVIKTLWKLKCTYVNYKRDKPREIFNGNRFKYNIFYRSI